MLGAKSRTTRAALAAGAVLAPAAAVATQVVADAAPAAAANCTAHTPYTWRIAYWYPWQVRFETDAWCSHIFGQVFQNQQWNTYTSDSGTYALGELFSGTYYYRTIGKNSDGSYVSYSNKNLLAG